MPLLRVLDRLTFLADDGPLCCVSDRSRPGDRGTTTATRTAGAAVPVVGDPPTRSGASPARPAPLNHPSPYLTQEV